MEVQGEPVVTGTENIKIKGKQYECWVLRIPIAFDGAGARSSYLIPEPMKLWIERSSGLLLRSEIRSHVPTQLQTTAIHDMKVTDIRLNELTPAFRFDFTPPKNAREIPQIDNQEKP
jgi:hypothetical protein